MPLYIYIYIKYTCIYLHQTHRVTIRKKKKILTFVRVCNPEGHYAK